MGGRRQNFISTPENRTGNRITSSNLDRFTSRLEQIAELRRNVLSLAVRGRLSVQDPKRGRPQKLSGGVYRRENSAYWWVRYPNAKGGIEKESTGTADREEAERSLRSRLEARDQGKLPVVLSGKTLTFNEWADWFLERRSKPPFRAGKTHQANLNALKFLRPVFGALRLGEITPESIEEYIANRLGSGRRIQMKLGVVLRGV
jgi:hypothetical protein